MSSKWIDRVKNSRVGNLLRIKRAATGAPPSPNDHLSTWFAEAPRVLKPAIQRLQQNLAPIEEGTDWNDRLKIAKAQQHAIKVPGLRCLQDLQNLVQTADYLPSKVAQGYFDSLEKTISGSIKTHIYSLPDGPLKSLALKEFLLWKDKVLKQAIETKSVRWETPLARSANFGKGMDSRIVEIPLAFEMGDFSRPGKVLDAGCALNHPFMHDFVPPAGAKVFHMTQSAEREPPLFSGDRFSYVFGDLRDIPFKDHTFDRVLCISTLEHIGSDNSRYYSTGGQENRKESYHEAMREMLRVLKPGGVLFVTFPYGPYQDQGWYQILGPTQVNRLIEVASKHRTQARYYYSDGCWFEGPGELVETMPTQHIEDAVAAICVQKSA